MDTDTKRAPDRVRPVIPLADVDAKGTRPPAIQTSDFEEQLTRPGLSERERAALFSAGPASAGFKNIPPGWTRGASGVLTYQHGNYSAAVERSSDGKRFIAAAIAPNGTVGNLSFSTDVEGCLWAMKWIADHESAHLQGVDPKTIAEGRSQGDKLDALIAERGRVHGNFTDHARITQRLKAVVLDELGRRHERGQPGLTDEAREALDMIVHKIGRVIAGDPDFKDHFADIAGYARLVEERCTK